MAIRSRHAAFGREQLVEAQLRDRSKRMMGMERREPHGSFIYEPGVPPSIPPDLEIAEWRAQRSQDP